MVPLTLDAVDLLLRVSAATVGAQEVGANDGAYVRRILKRVGNKPPDPWCAAWVTDVGLCALGEAWPVERTASVARMVEWAKFHDCLLAPPTPAQPGDLFCLWFPSLKRHAHVGIVTAVNADGSILTREGNTNAEGGREGWCVAEKTRTLTSRDRLIRWAK